MCIEMVLTWQCEAVTNDHKLVVERRWMIEHTNKSLIHSIPDEALVWVARPSQYALVVW